MSVDRSEQIDSHEAHLVAYFRERISKLFSLSETLMPDDIEVVQSDDPTFSERFPAVLDINSHSKAKLFYNRQSIEEIANPYGAQSLASFEKMYIAGSIALGMLLNNIDTRDCDKIRLLSEQLTSITHIEAAIEANDAFDGDDILNLKLSLRKSADERLNRIGILRFVTGMYEFLSDDMDQLEFCRREAMVNIGCALRSRHLLKLLLSASQIMHPADVDYRIDRQFTDAVSEMSLALAFPMEVEELRAVITLATTNKTEGVLYTEEVIGGIDDEVDEIRD